MSGWPWRHYRRMNHSVDPVICVINMYLFLIEEDIYGKK